MSNVDFVHAFGFHRISRIRFPSIGFSLFVLLERRSGDACSMPWGVRGTLVSWADCSVGAPSCRAPPRRPAVRPDPTHPWYVQVLDSTSRFTLDFACSCFWRVVQAICSRCFGGYEGGLFPGRTVLSASSPDRPRPFALPCAPLRPAHGMFEFWTRQVCQRLFLDMPCMKRVYRDKQASAHWSATGNEERFSSR